MQIDPHDFLVSDGPLVNQRAAIDLKAEQRLAEIARIINRGRAHAQAREMGAAIPKQKAAPAPAVPAQSAAAPEWLAANIAANLRIRQARAK